MTKLHLGVIDVPYTSPQDTTGKVAEILEAKYHVLETFFDSRKEKISKELAKSAAGALENMMLGAPIGASPFSSAEQFIDKEFRAFLSSSEIEKMGIAGVPTQAALDGVSHRFKSPYYKIVGKGKNKKKVKRSRRPSFIDTGLYQKSMKSWFE